MNDEELLKEISHKLSAIITCLMTPEVHKGSTSQKISWLARLSLSNQQIADILGTTKGTVKVSKSLGNKRRRGK